MTTVKFWFKLSQIDITVPIRYSFIISLLPRSKYTSAEDSTVEEVMFWEGEPRGPSKLFYPGKLQGFPKKTPFSKFRNMMNILPFFGETLYYPALRI